MFAQLLGEKFSLAGRRLRKRPLRVSTDIGMSSGLRPASRAKRDTADRASRTWYACRCGSLTKLASASLKVAAGLGLSGSVGVVAHDFTDEHRALLGTNGLAYVLHQDIHYCISTAARVLRALCENVRGALNVVQPRVEILTAENLH